jgi:hypothetical protein
MLTKLLSMAEWPVNGGRVGGGSGLKAAAFSHLHGVRVILEVDHLHLPHRAWHRLHPAQGLAVRRGLLALCCRAVRLLRAVLAIQSVVIRSTSDTLAWGRRGARWVRQPWHRGGGARGRAGTCIQENAENASFFNKEDSTRKGGTVQVRTSERCLTLDNRRSLPTHTPSIYG